MKYVIYEKLSEKSDLSICIIFMHEKPNYTYWICETNKWHFKCLFWSCILTLVSNELHPNQMLDPLAQTTSYIHVMIMHHIVALHWLCFLLFAGVGSLSVDVVPMMSLMTLMKSYTIFRSATQAKPPCSFRYNPTLSLLLSFTAIGQQRFNCYMLR